MWKPKQKQTENTKAEEGWTIGRRRGQGEGNKGEGKRRRREVEADMHKR